MTGSPPDEFRSDKMGRMVLMTAACFPRCKRGHWTYDEGVECDRCHRIFDPDFPEPDPCTKCGKKATPEDYPRWWAVEAPGEQFLCDACAGYKQEATA